MFLYVVTCVLYHRGKHTWSNNNSNSDSTKSSSNGVKGKSTPSRRALSHKQTVIGLIFSLFLFLYVGMEYCFGTYLTVFGVQSKLQLTR